MKAENKTNQISSRRVITSNEEKRKSIQDIKRIIKNISLT